MSSKRILTSSSAARRRLPGRIALVGLAALAAATCGCSQCGSPSTGASSTGPTSSAGSTPTGSIPTAMGAVTACASPAVESPPECKLIHGAVKSPSFSPDGRTVLVAAVRTKPDGTAVESTEVWDGRKGAFVKTLARGLEPHGGLSVVWSPDGSRVAAAGVGDSHFGFRIFDATAWKPLHEEDSRYEFPCALALDPAGERVAVTTLIGTAAIFDLKTGKRTASLTTNELRAAGHVCSMLEWSGDGKAIQVEGLRETSSLRPVPYRPARPSTAPPAAGAKPVRDEDLVVMRLAPRGDVVAFLDRKGNVRLFSKHGTVPMRVLPAARDVPAPGDPTFPPVRGVAWSPDARALATWDHTGKIRVWDAEKGDMVRELRAGAKPFEGLPDPEVESARIAWAPDGRSFAFWDGERPELWSLEDGTQKLKNQSTPRPEFPGMGHLSFSPDGSLLAAGRALHDTKTGAFVRALPTEAAQWLDSGRSLLLAQHYQSDGPLRVLRVSDGALLSIERLGDDASPVLLPHTEDGVFQGPRELAGCALPPALPDAGAGDAGAQPAGKRPAPEPRDTLLADFWAGKPVSRTCP